MVTIRHLYTAGARFQGEVRDIRHCIVNCSMHFGIDLGSQLKGTTAICYDTAEGLQCVQSAAGASADELIKSRLEDLRPRSVFLDAPLSLPAAYHSEAADDFMFREADRSLRAMSPLFLGGLTARAMRLCREMERSGILCLETYPSALVRALWPEGQELYDKKRREGAALFSELLKDRLPLPLLFRPGSWHQADALLCWLSGARYLDGKHKAYGNPEEGCIIV